METIRLIWPNGYYWEPNISVKYLKELIDLYGVPNAIKYIQPINQEQNLVQVFDILFKEKYNTLRTKE